MEVFFCYHCYFSANKKNPHSLTMQEFAHVFFDKLQVLLNAFQPKPILCVGRDCVKKDNWRLELYKEYKARRKHIQQIGPILHHVYNTNGLNKQEQVKYYIIHTWKPTIALRYMQKVKVNVKIK